MADTKTMQELMKDKELLQKKRSLLLLQARDLELQEKIIQNEIDRQALIIELEKSQQSIAKVEAHNAV